jgi:hypothetical protein
MNLFELTHTRTCAGGVQKPQQKNFKIGGQCSPSFNEGWCQAR